MIHDEFLYRGIVVPDPGSRIGRLRPGQVRVSPWNQAADIRATVIPVPAAVAAQQPEQGVLMSAGSMGFTGGQSKTGITGKKQPVFRYIHDPDEGTRGEQWGKLP
jgi:hypothetical protein